MLYILNTSVKVSGGAHHYLPSKVSLKLGASKKIHTALQNF